MCFKCVNKLSEAIIEYAPQIRERMNIEELIKFVEIVFMLEDKMKETSKMTLEQGINYLEMVNMSQLEQAIKELDFLKEIFQINIGDIKVISLDFSKIMDGGVSSYN